MMPADNTGVPDPDSVRLTADHTRHSSLVLCSCGARFAATNRATAYRAAADHVTRAHPGAWQVAHKARNLATQLDRRAR